MLGRRVQRLSSGTLPPMASRRFLKIGAFGLPGFALPLTLALGGCTLEANEGGNTAGNTTSGGQAEPGARTPRAARPEAAAGTPRAVRPELAGRTPRAARPAPAARTPRAAKPAPAARTARAARPVLRTPRAEAAARCKPGEHRPEAPAPALRRAEVRRMVAAVVPELPRPERPRVERQARAARRAASAREPCSTASWMTTSRRSAPEMLRAYRSLPT